jgi:hypothetical protein
VQRAGAVGALLAACETVVCVHDWQRDGVTVPAAPFATATATAAAVLVSFLRQGRDDWILTTDLSAVALFGAPG